jgi:thiamine biosynthesis lipoprotein
MGTDCHIMVVGPEAEARADQAEELVHDLERRWSRFLPDSEISALNRQQGKPVRVSAETIELLTNAVTAWRLTEGRFDPTMERHMVAIGYDRPFEQMDSQPMRDRAADPDPVRVDASCGDIIIDRAAATVTLPLGLTLDVGGIGKGQAADVTARRAIEEGAWKR